MLILALMLMLALNKLTLMMMLANLRYNSESVSREASDADAGPG